MAVPRGAWRLVGRVWADAVRRACYVASHGKLSGSLSGFRLSRCAELEIRAFEGTDSTIAGEGDLSNRQVRPRSVAAFALSRHRRPGGSVRAVRLARSDDSTVVGRRALRRKLP